MHARRSATGTREGRRSVQHPAKRTQASSTRNTSCQAAPAAKQTAAKHTATKPNKSRQSSQVERTSTALRAKPVITVFTSSSCGSHVKPGISCRQEGEGRAVGAVRRGPRRVKPGVCCKQLQSTPQRTQTRRHHPAPHQRLNDDSRVVLGLAGLAGDVAHARPAHLQAGRGRCEEAGSATPRGGGASLVERSSCGMASTQHPHAALPASGSNPAQSIRHSPCS